MCSDKRFDMNCMNEEIKRCALTQLLWAQQKGAESERNSRVCSWNGKPRVFTKAGQYNQLTSLEQLSSLVKGHFSSDNEGCAPDAILPLALCQPRDWTGNLPVTSVIIQELYTETVLVASFIELVVYVACSPRRDNSLKCVSTWSEFKEALFQHCLLFPGSETKPTIAPFTGSHAPAFSSHHFLCLTQFTGTLASDQQDKKTTKTTQMLCVYMLGWHVRNHIHSTYSNTHAISTPISSDCDYYCRHQ